MSINDNTPPFYECEFCRKKITRHDNFIKHVCEKLKRHALCKTKKGLGAFLDYTYWLKTNNRAIPKMSTFIDSKFFNSFIEFQKFCSERGIPDKKLYIQFMASRQLSPMLWRTPNLYDAFVQHYDENVSPQTKVHITLDTMDKLSNILECDISDIFDNLLPSEVSRLIFERRLSPWLLLFSDRFKKYLQELKDPAQYIMLSSTIDATEWRNIFKKDPDSVKYVKSIVHELKI